MPHDWPERLTLRDTTVFADEGQRIYTTATGYGYERHEYVRSDLAAKQQIAAIAPEMAPVEQWRKFAKIVRELGPSMSPSALAAALERKADGMASLTASSSAPPPASPSRPHPL